LGFFFLNDNELLDTAEGGHFLDDRPPQTSPGKAFPTELVTKVYELARQSRTPGFRENSKKNFVKDKVIPVLN
jgi:hypothetical protein